MEEQEGSGTGEDGGQLECPAGAFMRGIDGRVINSSSER